MDAHTGPTVEQIPHTPIAEPSDAGRLDLMTGSHGHRDGRCEDCLPVEADATRRPALAGDDIAAHTVQLTKVNGSGGTRVVALDSVDVQFQQGSFTAEMGPSGSGKSTLMHCVAGLDSPTSGRIVIGDTEIGPLKDKQLTQLGRDRIGFVFQAFNAVPTLTAAENILLPPAIAGRKHDPDW